MKKMYHYQSEHFRYDSIRVEDTEALVEWRSNPDIIKYYSTPLPVTRESHLNWFYKTYLKDDRRFDFIVSDGEIQVGFVALMYIDYEAKAAEVNYTIGNPDYTGRRLSPEMINALLKFGNSEFGLREFTAAIHKENIASQKAILSAGFCLEDESGIFWKYGKKVEEWLPM